MTFPIPITVQPVIDLTVRGLCPKPYHGHPKGCPNFNKPSHGHRCPPTAPIFDRYFDLSRPVFAVVNEFDLGEHMSLLAQHPRKDGKEWTEAQLKCVLYWQPTARNQLRGKVDTILSSGLFTGYEATECPEGMGVNVTATLANVGIVLEWPPEKIVRQVALLGVPIKPEH